jgi:phosphoribosylformimino-5-aminoimidazole carboxamide ribotide isomerase
MLLIPAIDLKEGSVFVCVRDAWMTIRFFPMTCRRSGSGLPPQKNPSGDLMARLMENREMLTSFMPLLKPTPMPIQIGGGIRDEETIQAYLNAGGVRHYRHQGR